eukprot:scaffold2132_cov66-Cyclotella_meneghiniana.AAC.9
MNNSRAVGSTTSSAAVAEVALDDFDVDVNLTPLDLSGTPRNAMNLGFAECIPRRWTGCSS